MKTKPFNRFAYLLALGGALATGSLFAQTVEINPAGAIPAGYALAPSGTWEWNTDGNLESWTANAGLTLDAGTPIGGSVSGTAATGDPNLSSATISIATPLRTIVEFRLNKQATDPSEIQVYWADASGGIAAARLFAIPGATFAADDNFKVVRVTFPFGKINTNLTKLRIDPINDPGNIGKTMSLDYVRVYTETVNPLTWDPDTVTTGAQGGTGTWNQSTTANWWDGAADVVWPASGKTAVFAGTAGTVTVSGTVNANLADFQTTGYTLNGGIINLGSDSAFYNNSVAAVSTRINSELQGSAPLSLKGTTFILGGNNTSLTSPVTQTSQYLGLTSNTALGSATYTAGAGGNAYINALDGDRSIANNVVFAGNRMLIDNTDLGTGLTVGNLTIGGNLALNCISPGDLYLRKNLTVDGVVSGSNSGIGLFLAGNAGTLRLNSANTFTGGIKWAVSSIVEVAADNRLGDAANGLTFNAGAGTLRALAGFSSARAIAINGSTTGKIDTNGFDVALSSVITGTTVSGTTILQKVGTGKLTLNGTGSILNGGIRIDAGTCDITGGSILTTLWSGTTGVGGGAEINVLGGSFNTQNYLSVGTNATPTLEALLRVNGGTFTCGLELLVGQNGNGRFTVTSGTVNLNQLSYGDGPDASRTASIDLDGGTVNMSRTNRRGGSATATINFNGSNVVMKSTQTDLLRGTPADTTFSVKAGGAIFDTATFNVTLAQPLVHNAALGATLDGGLTKNGAGTMTLNATNTYTGPTKVNAGVLEVNGNAIFNTGKLDIVGGKVLIPASTVETVDTLFYNGVQQPAGVYGSTISAAVGPNQNDTYFDVAGSGTLNVNTGPAPSNTYATWLAANPPATGFTTDSDNDGVSNGVENVLGTNPNTSSAGLTQVSATASSVTFEHMLNPTIASDVSYSYQWSSDLTEWKASGVANTAGTIGTIVASAPASGVVTVTTTRSGTASSKMFTRINVIKTP